MKLRFQYGIGGLVAFTLFAGSSLALWLFRNPWNVERVLNLKAPVLSVVFSPNGKYLVTSKFDNRSEIVEVESGKEIASFSWDSVPNTEMKSFFSQDGQQVAQGMTPSSPVKIFELKSERIAKADESEFLPQQNLHLFLDGYGGPSELFITSQKVKDNLDFEFQEIDCVMLKESLISFACFSPDHSRIATTPGLRSDKGIVMVWTRRFPHGFVGHMHRVEFWLTAFFGAIFFYVVVTSLKKPRPHPRG